MKFVPWCPSPLGKPWLLYIFYSLESSRSNIVWADSLGVREHCGLNKILVKFAFLTYIKADAPTRWHICCLTLGTERVRVRNHASTLRCFTLTSSQNVLSSASFCLSSSCCSLKIYILAPFPSTERVSPSPSWLSIIHDYRSCSEISPIFVQWGLLSGMCSSDFCQRSPETIYP